TDIRYRYSAAYARLGYNYQDQYLINFTARKDASSRFGPGKQIANFGAVGGAWIFSKQDVIKDNLSFLSFGKLRASYGITGNDQISDYKFLSTYSANGLAYQGVAGLNPTSLTNPNYGWESVKKLEAGLDLGFIKDRILFNVSWYQNRTGNQLVGYSLPSITGFTSIQANLPAVIQNRGTEFELTTHNISGKDFSWTTSANLSVPRNKLLSYPNLANSSYATTYVEGMPLSISFLFHYTGVDPTTKQYTFEDVNKDGQVTYGSDRKPVFVGQKYFGGLNNSITYKGFQLDFFLQFVKQNGYNFLGSVPGAFSNSANQLASVIQSTNGGTGVQNFTQDYSSGLNNAYSSYFSSDGNLTDASFIRLKNISLSWNLTEKYLNYLKLRNVRIYVQGQNIFTITKYKGLDPEFSGSQLASLPPLRIIMAGIQLSL
ncbi:SusC/RagA family TonB-linked outer membrane protein, partial [Pedobacter sp. HMWF019]